MLRSALICSLIIFASAKLTLPESYARISAKTSKLNGGNKNLWVLKIEDCLDEIKLERGTLDENKDFNSVIGPLIVNFERRQQNEQKRKPSRVEEKTFVNPKSIFYVKSEIMKIVNKFTSFPNIEPDSYLSESDEGKSVSLALYFKGPYTALVVKCGRKQWHYFIQPPSQLPEWFYMERTNVDIIPDDIKGQFYVKLLEMLRVFLNFPV